MENFDDLLCWLGFFFFLFTIRFALLFWEHFAMSFLVIANANSIFFLFGLKN